MASNIKRSDAKPTTQWSRDYCWLTGMNPSDRVCMKLTIDPPLRSPGPGGQFGVFMSSVESGAGQHVVPSLTSSGWLRGRTSRLLY
jgi:hypothetical protein